MPKSTTNGLCSTERLNAYGVSKLFEDSYSAKGRYFVVRAKKNDLDFTRIAPIASKKAGKANKRNRIKRRIRAAFRQNKHMIPQGYDLGIIALYGVMDAEFTDIVRSLKDVTEKACDICNKNTSKNSHADNKICLSEDNKSDDS